VYCEILSFAKFPFGLIPKLLISPGGSAIFFPDFPGAYSDVIFFGFRQSKRPHLQFFRQFQYPLGRFPVVNHPREAAVLFGLSENAGDEAFPVHGGPPQIRGPGVENGSMPLTTFAQCYPFGATKHRSSGLLDGTPLACLNVNKLFIDLFRRAMIGNRTPAR
jgi:hypothetical protein